MRHGEAKCGASSLSADELRVWHQSEASRAAKTAAASSQSNRRLRLLAEERMHRDNLELARLHHQDLQPATLDSSILADHRYG